MDIYAQFQSLIKNYNADSRIVSVNHIQELESEYNKLVNDALIDNQLYDSYIRGYIDFSIRKKFPAVLSLIIIATPSPLIDLKFQNNGKDFYLKIPPTYSDRVEVTARIKKATAEIFNKYGYNTFSVVLPKKLIAVKSGLAKYGKNNLTYVKGMGSYNRLTLFATDLPSKNDFWQEIQILDRCKNCFSCQKKCPTSAINNNNFMIKAERCLTYFNEQPGKFPDWIENIAHNCIIGCIRCQESCPENKNNNSTSKFKYEFSEAETEMILNNIPFEKLPGNLQAKISNLCLKHYYKHLSRNIAILIENQMNKDFNNT